MTTEDEERLAEGIEKMGIALVEILKEIRQDIAEIKQRLQKG